MTDRKEVRRPGVSVAKAEVRCTTRSDGAVILENVQQLGPFARCVGDWLEHWAVYAPDRTFLSERAPDGEWRGVTYAEACRSVWGIAEALLQRGLGPDRPVAALSGNSIAMGLMTLGAMHAGIPFAPVSPAYATLSADGAKLRHVLGLLGPGLVFASDEATFAPPLRSAGFGDVELVTASAPAGRATSFDSLCATAPTERAARAFAAISPATVGKILFTSGSTGTPKGVMNTHRMMCSNMHANSQLMFFNVESPPTCVDWMPWNHTAGGNGSFNKTLRYGGTLYIDDGKPTPHHFHRTVENLMSVRSTSHTNVPKAYELLLAEFERNPGFRRHFFADLEYIGFAGAAMPRHHYERLKQFAREARGDRILFSAGYGATETAPAITVIYFDNDEPGNIGLPLPGTQVKLLANSDKLELRVKGPGVMPGYWRQEELTQQAFDDEGFYKIGDAVKFVDRSHPERGLLFDGRVAEDFKLSSATWVNVSAIRARALAVGAPVIQDVVVTGQDQEFIGLLVILNEPEVRARFGFPPDTSLREIAAHPSLRAVMQQAVDALYAQATGSSMRPQRALVLDTAPSLSTGELTEKGSLSQRVMLSTRKAEVETLYRDPPDPRVIVARA